jgi:hypothetical protein
MPLPRSLAEIFGAFGDALKGDIRKCVPATITTVHADRQTVDVQVATNELLFDDMGNALSLPAPSFSDVPLACMRGGGFFVWMPVAVGDAVLLVYSDQSADTWRSGDGSPQDPGFAGKHTADSPFAIPAFAPDAKMLTSPAGDAGKVIIGKDGGAAQIKISATDIELGASAGDAIALASKVDSDFKSLINQMGAAMVPPITTLPQVVAAVASLQALLVGPLAGGMPPVGSTLVKSG